MRFLVFDNNKPIRNTLIEADNVCDAIDEGASRLKTFNIRAIVASDKRITGTIDKLGFEILSYLTFS